MRLFSILLVFSMLAGCAGTPSGTAQPNASKAFHACFSESKLPWLVSVVVGDKSNTKPLDKLIADFVGGSSADQNRARTYLNDLKLQKYKSGQAMAGAHFNACLAQASAEKFEPSRATSCYQEQRIIFALQVLQDQNASQAEAAQHLIKANPSSDGSSESAIQRLAKDTYTLVKPGGESAFSAAQFQVCMTTGR